MASYQPPRRHHPLRAFIEHPLSPLLTTVAGVGLMLGGVIGVGIAHTLSWNPAITDTAAMPGEVRELLRSAGYEGFVEGAIDAISWRPDTFVPQRGTWVAGLSYRRFPTFTRVAEISFAPQGGPLLASRELARVLVHESAHLAYGRLGTAESERYARAVEEEFLAALERAERTSRRP